jgi:hypothetical protein
MRADERALADLQVALLDLLARSPSPAEVRARLGADPRLAPWRDWIAQLEPRMLEVAGALVRKWSR